jgi:tetratricopeptide (TPR) repeat protein
MAWADYWFQQETTEGTAKAIALAPDQSAYRVRLALLLGDEDSAAAVAALQRAVALNPADGRAWIELGLRLEASGDLAGAEPALLRAADEDKTYLPRWTLMNYYFRRNDPDGFWNWAKAAVPMIYGDPLPIFHLCGRVTEDGALIDRLEIRKPEIQAGYLFYLLDIARADLAGPASRCLLAGHREADVPLLLEACDRLIEARRVDDAVAISHGLGQSNGLPFRSSGKGAQSLLTNGDFAVSPTGHGFDWRLPALQGISASREESPAGLRLTFSGTEAEIAEPLVRFVPVSPNTAYELKYVTQTVNIAANSGLSWQIGGADASSNREVGEDRAADEWTGGRLTFVTSPGCRMVRLSLVYRRRAGSTRIRGYLVLRNVEMEAILNDAPAARGLGSRLLPAPEFPYLILSRWPGRASYGPFPGTTSKAICGTNPNIVPLHIPVSPP